MCGIWTRTRFSQAVKEDELIFPVRALSHRGPDGYGWWKSDDVALVHTRLGIIDLEGGAQPLKSFDGKWIGIVNGELYDFESHQQVLESQGVQFKTKSDSEVLLNLYAHRGLQGLGEISGEFAFIFYHLENRELHFGRDLFGVKPLFFERSADAFTISSETKALSECSPEFDPQYIKSFLARAVVPPRTCLKNVKHVWPGQVYTLDLKTRELSSKIYRSLPLFQDRQLDLPEAQEKLEYELRGAVKRRLRADVEIGCYLSGGIDSSLIAAMAADLGAKPRAFTVGFADKDFDESASALQIANELGLKSSQVVLTSKNFMEYLIRSIAAFENPITNPHGAAKNLLAHHTSQHVKVVLTGEGADEWLGGYAYLRTKKLQDFEKRHPRFGKGILDLFMARESGVSMGHLDGHGVRYNAWMEDDFSGHAPALLGRLVRERYFKFMTGEGIRPVVEDFSNTLSRQLREEHPHFRFSDWDLDMWIALRTDLMHYILANVGDRQEMDHSIEGRTPFLDPRVVEVAGRISESALMRGLTEKYVLRRIGQKYLDLSHANRRKRPFFAPLKYLLLKQNQAVIDDYIQICKKEIPWLAWGQLDHFLYRTKGRLAPVIMGSQMALKLTLFSIGVLSKHLRSVDGKTVRGYKLPDQVSDLMMFRRCL